MYLLQMWFSIEGETTAQEIQTRRSQKHVGSTSMSNISKHKIYFWKEKTIAENLPEVISDSQTVHLDNPCHNRPLCWVLHEVGLP